MINVVVLTGRITHDLELKVLPNTSVINFSIAVTRKFKTEDQDTDFFRMVVFGKQAETLAKYCSKGSLIGVEGRLQHRTYEKDNQTHHSTEIICTSITFLDNKKNVEDEETRKLRETMKNVKEDDLPF